MLRGSREHVTRKLATIYRLAMRKLRVASQSLYYQTAVGAKPAIYDFPVDIHYVRVDICRGGCVVQW